MRRLALLAGSGAVTFALTASPLHAQPAVPRFERGGTFPVELPAGEKIDTGFLVVREDRSRVDSRLLRLPVAILRGTDRQPSPDAVLYLPGGPGGSALNTARYGFAYPFLKHRDFVIFEPRGARLSEPAMMCPDVPGARVDDATRPDPKHAAEIAAARTCRERVTAAGIDPSAYTTAASAADADDLRRALGYAQWNLYGASYGTKVGLAILRQFPGTVRSAVFDSVLPPSVRYDEQSRASWAHVLDVLFEDCQAQPACRQAFPDLRRRWQGLLKAAAATPLVVSASADKDAPVRRISLGEHAMVEALPLSATDSLPDVPALLHGLINREPAALSLVGRRALRPSNYSWGLRYSVWCSEETPFVSTARATREPRVVSPEVCAVWNVKPASREMLAPVVSDVPVLLLSGEYDPDTPPAWAAAAARTLSKAHAITFRFMSHVPSQQWSTPCAMSLADAFLRDPSAPLDESCARSMTAPAFKTALASP